MKRLVLILLVSGLACGQFSRFDDSRSFESNDDTREVFFNTRASPNRVNGIRNSNNNFRRNRFRDSIDISDERFFNTRNRIDVTDENFSDRGRNRFDDSDEDRSDRGFFGTNRNSFVSRPRSSRPTQTNFFNRNAASPPRPRPRAPPRPTSSFGNTNRFRSSPNRLRFDSVEDLFEDLFDDDLDDRVRAQNALSRLQGGGRNAFTSNRGSSRNNGFTSFRTRLGNNRFTSPRRSNTRPFKTQFTNTRNALGHFSIPQHKNSISNRNTVNRFKNGFSFGTTLGNSNNRFKTNRNQFGSANRGVPLSSTNRRPSSPANTFRRLNNNNNSNKKISSSPRNSISRNSFGSAKKTSFTSPPGFNWPGGNGYYVRMSTGNSKPFSYFVKYDD